MRLGEYLSLIKDEFISIIVIAEESGIDGVNPGEELFRGAIFEMQNYPLDDNTWLDELYVDTIDIDANGVFTIYVC